MAKKIKKHPKAVTKEHPKRELDDKDLGGVTGGVAIPGAHAECGCTAMPSDPKE